MSYIAFFLIALSAVFHVTWHTMVKKIQMSIPLYALLATAAMLTWVHALFWTPVKITALPTGFWLAVLGSISCDTLFYCIGLTLTYKRMPMSTAYPIMRALPILFTLLITSVFKIDARIQTIGILGMVVVFLGCLLMPLKNLSEFKLKNYMTPSMFFILLTALGTTGYTIFDSLSMKQIAKATDGSGISTPVLSMTYYGIRELLLTLTTWTLSMSTRHNRQIMHQLLQPHNLLTSMLTGICASATYITVLLAMIYVTNVSYVQVFRQIGLPLSMFAGIIFLKEPRAKIKFVGCALIIIGLVLTII